MYMTSYMIIRALGLFMGTVGCAAWIDWARHHRDRWRYAVAPLSWLGNVTLFYLYLFLAETLNARMINIWSGVIHLQGIILLSGLGLIMMYPRKKLQHD